MIVDDHEEILRLTNEILNTKNYEIGMALDGETCLRNVESFNPDMILLDLMMPEMSGFEVLDELEKKRIHETVKIVAFTVKNLWEEDMKRITANPLYHYIGKPFTNQELFDQIDSIFQEKKKTREEPPT